MLILGDIVPLKYLTCCEQVFLKWAQSPGGGEGLLCTIGCFGVLFLFLFFKCTIRLYSQLPILGTI